MLEPGDLTKTGLLYEGSDFAEWKHQIVTVLRMHSIEDQVLSHFDRSSEPLEKRRMALELTLARVYHPLRSRIPTALYMRLWDLVPWVKKHLVRPFRLLDLPPELRNQIFSYALRPDAEIILAPLKGNVNSFPPMTAVSRQLRNETIPLCYAQCTLRIDLTAPRRHALMGFYKEKDFLATHGVKSCIRQLSTQHLKNLRQVHLSLSLNRERWPHPIPRVHTLNFTFSPVQGLRTRGMLGDTHIRLSMTSKKKLDDHIRKTEEMRRLLGLRGEALVLALTSDESLWKSGTLALAFA